MDDINVLHHRCLLNLRRRIRDIGDGRPAQERYMRLQKDGDTLRSACSQTDVIMGLCWIGFIQQDASVLYRVCFSVLVSHVPSHWRPFYNEWQNVFYYAFQNFFKQNIPVNEYHFTFQRHTSLCLFHTTELKGIITSNILSPRPPTWWCCFLWWPRRNQTTQLTRCIYC